MYDFYLGDNNSIENNEESFLLSIKRMLPKWMNSIPDSEFLALHRVINTLKERKNVSFAETGVGASTIVLLYEAIKRDGILYSWDTNSEKASQIRSICVETISKYLKADINKHWIFVNYNSTSEHSGLNALRELDVTLDLFFHDSEHTLDVVLKEIKTVSKLMESESIICMDDANYNFKHTNTAFINLTRKKLGLPPIEEIQGNLSRPFYIEVNDFLETEFDEVNAIDNTYQHEYIKDIYFEYFNVEYQVKASLKMENDNDLANRFYAWKLKISK